MGCLGNLGKFESTKERNKMATIREWRNEEWDSTDKRRNQYELAYMYKRIMANADKVENKPTPGHCRADISRVIIAKCSFMPNFEYIIHTAGFTIEDIVEIYRTDEELKRLEEYSRND